MCFKMEGYSFYTWWYFWLESYTSIWISIPQSDDVKQTKKTPKLLIKCFVSYKEWHVPIKKNHNTSISSATRYTESRKKVHEASSISDRLELKRGCVRERLSVSHTTGSQMGFCAAERVNKLFLFSVQTELKLSQKLQHGNKLYLITTTINKPKKKKISFTKKKGAFSRDLRRVQMGKESRLD